MSTQEWKDAHKDEQREYKRKWYSRNRKQHIQEVSHRKIMLRQQATAYKAARGCNRCPETDAACLDFHHKGNKEKGIADAITNGWSWDKLFKEISKCEILCSNCHRKEHAKLV